MNFSYAAIENASELVSLINSAYRLPSSSPGWTDEREVISGPRIDAQTILSEFEAGRFLLSRTAPEEEVVGCVHISGLEDNAWYISLLAVKPTYQRGGLGASILNEVEKQAAAEGASCLRITVINHRQPLIAWYERRGFRKTGAEVPFPYDDPSVGIPLRDDLALVILEKPLTADETTD